MLKFEIYIFSKKLIYKINSQSCIKAWYNYVSRVSFQLKLNCFISKKWFLWVLEYFRELLYFSVVNFKQLKSYIKLLTDLNNETWLGHQKLKPEKKLVCFNKVQWNWITFQRYQVVVSCFDQYKEKIEKRDSFDSSRATRTSRMWRTRKRWRHWRQSRIAWFFWWRNRKPESCPRHHPPWPRTIRSHRNHVSVPRILFTYYIIHSPRKFRVRDFLPVPRFTGHFRDLFSSNFHDAAFRNNKYFTYREKMSALLLFATSGRGSTPRKSFLYRGVKMGTERWAGAFYASRRLALVSRWTNLEKCECRASNATVDVPCSNIEHGLENVIFVVRILIILIRRYFARAFLY